MSKRNVKSEDIKNSIQNYVIQRNLPLKNSLKNNKNNSLTPLDISSHNTDSESLIKKKVNQPQQFKMPDDLDLMILNDLTLIESSINDFYDFSFGSLSSVDQYKKQFEVIKTFINTSNLNDLKSFIFPIFVFICIDLIKHNNNIIDFITEQSNQDDNNYNEMIINELKTFNNSKNELKNCPQLQQLLQNKIIVKICQKSWQSLVNFMSKSDVHLLLRILNLNLQILISDNHIDNTEIELEDVNLISNIDNNKESILNNKTLNTDLEILQNCLDKVCK
jgi:hypothetical protein